MKYTIKANVYIGRYQKKLNITEQNLIQLSEKKIIKEDSNKVQALEKELALMKQQIQEFSETQDHLVQATFREREMKKTLVNTLKELQDSKKLIETQNKKISESIQYAQRIQQSIIPSSDLIKKFLPESFILYRPKDVVSGDFPWFFEKGDDIYIAAVDCTGHGVPGAMLSLIGCFLLNEINSHAYSLNPNEILDLLHTKVIHTLKQHGDNIQSTDGMDIALCKINLKENEVQFSGAYRPLYLVKGDMLEQFKGDRKSIGGRDIKKEIKFTNHQFKVQKGDTLYFFSDGLPDQFGGSEELKYGPKRIRDLVVQHSKKEMNAIYNLLEQDLSQWQGDGPQIDDILLFGIRF